MRMAKARDVQGCGITFGRWKLVPVDDRNWELCQWRETADTASARKAGTVGEAKWHRLGRFYSWNTFRNALMYAADVEMKERCFDAECDIRQALRDYDGIVQTMADDMEWSVREGALR